MLVLLIWSLFPFLKGNNNHITGEFKPPSSECFCVCLWIECIEVSGGECLIVLLHLYFWISSDLSVVELISDSFVVSADQFL